MSRMTLKLWSVIMARIIQEYCKEFVPYMFGYWDDRESFNSGRFVNFLSTGDIGIYDDKTDGWPDTIMIF
jgi:hypothetical protein